MLGFDALAGAPLSAGPSPMAAPAPVDDLDGAVILQVPARCTLAVVEARTVVVAVAARQTMIEVTRGR